MSKKSTARTGSEGDADSTTFSEVFANIRPGSSSCQTKRELEGGPFGDSPCENTQQMLKDCFILMFRDDDTSTEASESSEIDQELYNLQNDYLEKLNVVRRTLNLLEIGDEDGSLSPNRCTITEIFDEETSSENSAQNNQEDCAKEEFTLDRVENEEISTKANDLVTILQPPVKCYNFDPASTVSLFELNYNPPKKKLCYRQKTPRPTSLSEGNLPYYTRVGLHDDLFGPNKNLVNTKNLMGGNGNGNINKLFIETKETQCTDEDFSILNKAKPKEEIFIFGQLNNINLFPEVIIENATKNSCESSSSSSAASVKSIPISKCTKEKTKESVENIGLSLNIVDDNSDDSFTTTTYSTTIDSPERNKTVKKRFGRRHRVSSTEKLTLWEEIRKMHSSRSSNNELNKEPTIDNAISESKVEKPVDKHIKPKKGNAVYIKQYLRYKKQMDKPRSWSIPFGTTVTDRHAEFQASVEYFRPSENSSISMEDKAKHAVAGEDSEIRSRVKFLVRACFCCWTQRAS